jgi:hypothetical protein
MISCVIKARKLKSFLHNRHSLNQIQFTNLILLKHFSFIYLFFKIKNLPRDYLGRNLTVYIDYGISKDYLGDYLGLT